MPGFRPADRLLFSFAASCALCFPGASGCKESAGSAGDLGLIPGQEDFRRREWQLTPICMPEELHGQRSLVWVTVHGAAKSRTRLSD